MEVHLKKLVADSIEISIITAVGIKIDQSNKKRVEEELKKYAYQSSEILFDDFENQYSIFHHESVDVASITLIKNINEMDQYILKER